MDRRKFLDYLSGTAAGAALAPMLDLDKLLWVPGAKTIFIPPPPVVQVLRAPFGAFEIGDVLTIAGYQQYSPTWRADRLQVFKVTAFVSDGIEMVPWRLDDKLKRMRKIGRRA